MEKFYEENNIPSYLGELLRLMGVVSLADLLEIDGDFIDDIEKQVRDGNFNSQVDFESTQNKLKYILWNQLGFDGNISSPPARPEEADETSRFGTKRTG